MGCFDTYQMVKLFSVLPFLLDRGEDILRPLEQCPQIGAVLVLGV